MLLVVQNFKIIVLTSYELTIQINSDNHVLSHPAGANDAANFALAGSVIIDDISRCVPHYAPYISSRKLMLGRIVSKAATEMSYFKRSYYMKELTTENNCTFEIGPGNVIDIGICNSWIYAKRLIQSTTSK